MSDYQRRSTFEPWLTDFSLPHCWRFPRSWSPNRSSFRHFSPESPGKISRRSFWSAPRSRGFCHGCSTKSFSLEAQGRPQGEDTSGRFPWLLRALENLRLKNLQVISSATILMEIIVAPYIYIYVYIIIYLYLIHSYPISAYIPEIRSSSGPASWWRKPSRSCKKMMAVPRQRRRLWCCGAVAGSEMGGGKPTGWLDHVSYIYIYYI